MKKIWTVFIVIVVIVLITLGISLMQDVKPARAESSELTRLQSLQVYQNQLAQDKVVAEQKLQLITQQILQNSGRMLERELIDAEITLEQQKVTEGNKKETIKEVKKKAVK